jgi:hypothetical protein
MKNMPQPIFSKTNASLLFHSLIGFLNVFCHDGYRLWRCRQDHPAGQHFERHRMPVFFEYPADDRAESITPSAIGIVAII